MDASTLEEGTLAFGYDAHHYWGQREREQLGKMLSHTMN
jgi:hypothetical protein